MIERGMASAASRPVNESIFRYEVLGAAFEAVDDKFIKMGAACAAERSFGQVIAGDPVSSAAPETSDNEEVA